MPKIATVFGALIMMFGILQGGVGLAGAFLLENPSEIARYFPGKNTGDLIDRGLALIWAGILLTLVGQIAEKVLKDE